jgi:hypothetical protein
VGIEASVVAAYVIAWVMQKVRRTGGRLDAEVDSAIDAGLDKLHDTVAAKLGADPVLEDVEEEASGEDGQVSELTRQRVELSLTAAARKDEAFGQAVTEQLEQIRAAERRGGAQVPAGDGSAVFTGDAHAQANGGGIAIGQVGRDANFDRGESPGPSQPGR